MDRDQSAKSSRRSGRLKTALLNSLLLSLTACTHNQPASTTPPAPSPAQISSSAEVVKISARPVVITAAGSPGSQNAEVEIDISPGFHINANPATFPYLIATQLEPGKLQGVVVGKPIYPAPVNKKFQFAEQPLAVYESKAIIALPLQAGKSALENQKLPITVRVQACDNEKCYAPATVQSAISVIVPQPHA
jgi:hypothetical protein